MPGFRSPSFGRASVMVAVASHGRVEDGAGCCINARRGVERQHRRRLFVRPADQRCGCVAGCTAEAVPDQPVEDEIRRREASCIIGAADRDTHVPQDGELITGEPALAIRPAS